MSVDPLAGELLRPLPMVPLEFDERVRKLSERGECMFVRMYVCVGVSVFAR